MTAVTFWFTGLPGAGKTTLANAVAHALRTEGRAALVLDGDEVRRTLSADLGFDAASRDENVRRVAAVAALAVANDVFSLVALVSPNAVARDRAKAAHAERGQRFFEIHLSAPREVCERRDPKGLYARARAGEVKQLTGVDAPYEAPTHPALQVPPDWSVEVATQRVLALLSA